MKNYLRLFLSDGLGSVAYNGPSPLASGNPTLIGANDGLSTDAATGKIAQLGQTVGRAGDPAILTENREIPDPGGFTISIGRNNGVDNNVLIGPDLGVAVGNNTGNGFQAQWAVGGHDTGIDIFTDDGDEVFLDFNTVEQLTYNASPSHLKRLEYSGPLLGHGLGAYSRVVNSLTNPTDALLAKDFLLLCNTAGGNLVEDVDPTLIPQQFFVIKKTSADINTITITPLSGTIQGFGAPAATFAFNSQGASFTIFSDGVNLFII